MSSIFTQILSGEIPCHKIMEDDKYFSFMEIKPINPGHALVIPKQEIDYIFDMEDSLLTGLTLFAKKVACAVQKTVPCKKIGIVVYGLEVRHAHIHLIPIHGTPNELNFGNAKMADPSSLAILAEAIRKNL